MRVPDIRIFGESKRSPTLTEAAERWRSSRVDVTESTRVLHRVALDRVLPILGTRRVDEITTADVAALIAQLHAAGKKRATIRSRSPISHRCSTTPASSRTRPATGSR